jgi:hypothetical protein
VKFVDPTGKDIIISRNGGASTYKYRNGQLFSERMNPRTGKLEESLYTPTVGSFLEGVLNGLNDLAGTATGTSLISFFSSDERHVTIATDNAITSEMGNVCDMGAMGYPEILMKDDLSGSLIPTTNGMQTSPFWLDLGHEMAHAVDYYYRGATASNKNDGLFFAEPQSLSSTSILGTREPVSFSGVLQKTEIYATFMENLMRTESGLPLRTHYFSRGNSSGTGPQLLNTSRTSAFSGSSWLPVHNLNP